METKNLTKSFGIRVPLDMYLKMIEVGAENKISITDICLYSLANSGILKPNFKLGGSVNQYEEDRQTTLKVLKQRDRDIKFFENKVDDLLKVLKQKDRDIKFFENKVDDLLKLLHQKDEQIEDLKVSITINNNEISSLRKQLKKE